MIKRGLRPPLYVVGVQEKGQGGTEHGLESAFFVPRVLNYRPSKNNLPFKE
jgi:hypothetical protein